MKIKIIKIFTLLSILFIYFSISKAEVSFSEINYDPIGTDSGFEWVEVYNNNLSKVDFEEYSFCEGGSCHKLISKKENKKIIPKDNFAIISSNPDKFLEKFLEENNSEFSGYLFKSSFSLKNTDGEEMELKNKDKITVSFLKYNPESGGKDGDTLSVIDSVLVNSKATPGSLNVKKNIEVESVDGEIGEKEGNSEDEKEEKVKIQRAYVEIDDNRNSDLIDGKKKVKAFIEPFDNLIVGANHIFESKVYELSGADIAKPDQIKYFWNFGDGQFSNKKNPKHSYKVKGEYIISLKVLINGYGGKTKILVDVLDSPVYISDIDYDKKIIVLKNDSDFILNISNFMIVSQDEFFKMPNDTFINKKSELSFSDEVIDLKFDKNYAIALAYEDGVVVNIFQNEIEVKEDEKENLNESIKNDNVNIERENSGEASNNEAEILDIDNNIENKETKKEELIWNINNQNNIEYQRLLLENKKLQFELEKQKEKNKIKNTTKKLDKKKSDKKEENDKKLKKDINKEVNSDDIERLKKDNFYFKEEIKNLQESNSDDIREKIEVKNDFLNNIKTFFIDKIFYIILIFFIMLLSFVAYIAEKNNKKEKDEDVDKFDIEEL